MNLSNIHSVYFIGIGGIGMSALARYFHVNNKYVGGYDKTKTEITDGLSALGIHIHFNDVVAEIESVFMNPETTLVVYTPAVPSNHNELLYFKENNFKILKNGKTHQIKNS